MICFLAGNNAVGKPGKQTGLTPNEVSGSDADGAAKEKYSHNEIGQSPMGAEKPLKQGAD